MPAASKRAKESVSQETKNAEPARILADQNLAAIARAQGELAAAQSEGTLAVEAVGSEYQPYIQVQEERQADRVASPPG